MDRVTMEAAIKLCLQEISQRLERAASIGKAAAACAHAGNVDKGVEVALDICRPDTVTGGQGQSRAFEGGVPF